MSVSASLVAGVLDREPRAIARALSAVADDPAAASVLLSGIRGRTGRALLVGVTGPPGAGKSTLVDRLIKAFRGTGRTVGVLAVDPSSPFTGGALLGDRVRMQAHASDPGVFIRSLATRGQLGGLSSATADAADVLDAAGFDIVLIETVGVGQDELDIARLADVRVVVFMPDAGDDVQDMKAGLIEIGDIFVVNKSDREGADRTVASLQGSLRLDAGPEVAWVPPVVATVATDGTGVPAVTDAIERFQTEMAARVAERRRVRESERATATNGSTRVRVDHVGIAVSDPAPILSFLAEAFGAAAGPSIDVPAHGVRVRFVRLGGSSLEVLEALDGESPVAPFLARRGPGLHHVAIEVDDLDEALAEIARTRRASRGRVATTRAPMEGQSRSFIHPPPGACWWNWFLGGLANVQIGEIEITVLSDGFFRLDGGAMFGVIPRTMWVRRAEPDDRNRILMSMRPLLVRTGGRTMLIDAGAGDKLSPKTADIYGFDRVRNLDHALADAGVAAADIDVVLATHLHFDHAGGFTGARADGVVPRFPRARYLIRRGEWEDATHPHERNRASYLAENYVPLLEAGRVDFIDEDVEVLPGVSVCRTGGHTMHHQIVRFESGGRAAIFAADLIPTVAHVDLPWIMGYDLYPMDTLSYKRRFVAEAVEGEYVIFFEHDPVVTAGIIRQDAGRLWVEPISS